MNEINDLNEQLNKKLKEFNTEKRKFEEDKKSFQRQAEQKEQGFNIPKESKLTGNFTQDFFEIPTMKAINKGNNDFPSTLIKVQRKYHQNEIYEISSNLNGGIIATCGGDKLIRIYDSLSQQQKMSISATSRDQLYTCLSVSHHSELLIAGGTDNTATLLSLLTGKSKHSLTGHSSKINSVAFFSRDLCVTGSKDRSVKFWDNIKGYQVKSYACESQVSTLETFNCEPLILTGHHDGSIRIYSNRDSKPLNIIKNAFDQQVTSVKLSNNNNYLVASSKEGTFLKLYDIRNNNRLLQTLSDDNYINSHEYAQASFGPDDKTIISGNWDSSIIVWNINNARKQQVIEAGKDGAIICTLYHPISGQLYAGDSKGNLFIYH